MKVEKVYCDRCGAEIKKPIPRYLNILRRGGVHMKVKLRELDKVLTNLREINQDEFSGYGYVVYDVSAYIKEPEYELCPECGKKLKEFLKGDK